jgi:hypothetical protein
MQIKCIESNGSGYSVTVTTAEVLDFKDAWPCSELPDKAITFHFDSEDNLVDLEPDDIDGEALSALSCEVQELARAAIRNDYWFDQFSYE